MITHILKDGSMVESIAGKVERASSDSGRRKSTGKPPRVCGYIKGMDVV